MSEPELQPKQSEQSQQDAVPQGEPAGWKFSSEDAGEASDDSTPSSSSHEPVTWTASEYVAHEKGAMWYLSLAAIFASGTLLAFLFTRDYVTTAVVPVVGIIFGIAAARPPRVLNYEIDDQGLHIEAKSYPYNVFKSFSIVEEGAFHSIVLMPLKRFMPALTIYYAPEDEHKIADVLGSFLPVEVSKLDLIDRLMRKIRF